MNDQKAFRGEILHFIDDPATTKLEQCYEYYADGLLVIDANGLIQKVGEYQTLVNDLQSNTDVIHYKNGLITPGFVDTHIHYPQTEMVASYGEQLLEWLNNYTFPTEQKFSDAEYATTITDFFLDQLLQNGTTTALVFGTVHPSSVDAFFSTAQAKNLRMICGKVMMDRNAPDELLDTAESAYQDSKRLIEKWHGVDRLQYAVTPRFAPTSSPDQLQAAGKLMREFDDVYLHTHLSENTDEVAWVKSLFPESENYLGVYDEYNLLSRRSVFAHGIHLCPEECQRLGESQSSIAFCPTSNLFLGSGLFDLKQAEKFDINIGLGTDIGAGTSFSMLQTMNEAYKTQQLRGDKLNAFKSFYLATLGGARALDLEHKIGNFLVGNEADFVFLDYSATPLLKLRMQHCNTLEEKLFVLSMLGDDRTVGATHILGKRVK